MKNIKKHLEQIINCSITKSNIFFGIRAKPKQTYVEMHPKTRHNDVTN